MSPRRGLGKPETFNFLGFTFICGKTRQGKFQIKRKTRRDRMRAKLRMIREEMIQRPGWGGQVNLLGPAAADPEFAEAVHMHSTMPRSLSGDNGNRPQEADLRGHLVWSKN